MTGGQTVTAQSRNVLIDNASYTKAADITLDAGSSITLQVGDAKIIIDSSGISLAKGGSVKKIETASISVTSPTINLN